MPEGFPSESWCHQTAVLVRYPLQLRTEQGRCDSTKFFAKCRFRKSAVPFCMRAAKGRSIAPNFPKGVASENVLFKACRLIGNSLN